jgi:hypothetical protein
VPLLWPLLIEGTNVEIHFAVKNFKWSNNSSNQAGVTCSVIGLRTRSKAKKYLFEYNRTSEVDNINAYLLKASNIIVDKRSETISLLPKMVYGNMALDGGFLLLNDDEKTSLINTFPASSKFIRRTTGANEFIKGISRWCLWIEDNEIDEAKLIPPIKERINSCYLFRVNGGQVAKTLAYKPHQFRYRIIPKKSQIIIPLISSENREYLPCGFLEKDYVIQQTAQVIYDSSVWILSLLSSKIHLLWTKSVGGKLETRIAYSATICYNTFPFPNISKHRKEELTQCVLNILDERLKHSEKSIAELYDPDKMPEGLKEAHHQNDLAVERCYRSTPFSSDEERLEYLFKLYEKMIQEEKDKDTLFAKQKKTRKRK